MYDKVQIDAYMDIKAPEALRERVLNACGKQKRANGKIFRYSALAACLALIIALSVFFGSAGDIGISMSGTEIGEEPIQMPVSASMAAARSATGIIFEIDLDRPSDITTEDGEVYVFNAENGEAVSNRGANGLVTVVWNTTLDDTGKTYVLKIENSRGLTEVNLLFNEAAGWMVCCAEK